MIEGSDKTRGMTESSEALVAQIYAELPLDRLSGRDLAVLSGLVMAAAERKLAAERAARAASAH